MKFAIRIMVGGLKDPYRHSNNGLDKRLQMAWMMLWERGFAKSLVVAEVAELE